MSAIYAIRDLNFLPHGHLSSPCTFHLPRRSGLKGGGGEVADDVCPVPFPVHQSIFAGLKSTVPPSLSLSRGESPPVHLLPR